MPRLKRLRVPEQLEIRTLLAAEPVVVADLDVSLSPRDSPQDLTAIGDEVFFFQRQIQLNPPGYNRRFANTGDELWKTDGAETVLVESWNSVYRGPVAKQDDDIFFWLHLDGNYELRMISPNAAMSTVLHQFSNAVGEYSEFLVTDDAIYFVAFTLESGRELWRSDGTPEGTALVKDIARGLTGSSPTQLAHVNGQLFFSADDGMTGRELWTSDGTAAGTRLVADIAPAELSSSPQTITPFQGHVYFSAVDSDGRQIWRSDGSQIGTRRLDVENPSANEQLRIEATSSDEFLVIAGERVTSPGQPEAILHVTDGRSVIELTGGELVAVVGESVFFLWDESLWITDGSNAGTRMVGRFGDNEQPTIRRIQESFNNKLLFAVNDSELWISDGTTMGTRLLMKFESRILHVATTSEFVAFSAFDTLWRTDGTLDGTFVIAESDALDFFRLVRANNAWFFSRNSGETVGLWKTDGTKDGTTPVFRRYDSTEGSRAQIIDVALGDHGGKIFFETTTGINGGLWVTDGTSNGTTNIHSKLGNARVTPVHESIFFRSGSEVWFADGTVGGTRLVADRDSFGGARPRLTQKVGNLVLVATSDEKLWAMSVQAEDLRLVTDRFDEVDSIVPVGERAFLLGSSGDVRDGLWLTDGTTDGTMLLRDMVAETGTSPTLLTAVADQLFFSIRRTHMTEVWVSDGSASGTRLVRTIPITTPLLHSTGVKGKYLMTFHPRAQRTEVWASDGTEAGTSRIADLNGRATRNTATNRIREHMVVEVVRLANDTPSYEVWISDGSTEGTRLVHSTVGKPSMMSAGHEDFYFISRGELWRTESRRSVTNLLIPLGDLRLTKHDIIEMRNSVYFVADDFRYGEELRRLDLSDGDLNRNNKVDLDDVMILRQSYGKIQDAIFEEGDIDGDGDVDFADFLLLAAMAE